MLRNILAIALGATALAAPAAQRDADRAEARLAKRLDGLVAGRVEDCITPSPTGGSERFGANELIRDRNGTLYLAQFSNGCSIRESDALISRRPTTRLCRGEIVEGRDLVSGTTSGSCIYDGFVPYRRP